MNSEEITTKDQITHTALFTIDLIIDSIKKGYDQEKSNVITKQKLYRTLAEIKRVYKSEELLNPIVVKLLEHFEKEDSDGD